MFLDRRCRIRDGQWGSVHQRFNGETQLYGARWDHSVSLLRGTTGRLLACCCFDVKKMCVRVRVYVCACIYITIAGDGGQHPNVRLLVD